MVNEIFGGSISIYESRGAKMYFTMLFPEDPLPKNIGEQLACKFGGREQFFRPGATILDMGCGVGRAVSELSKQYRKHGVKVIGLNLPVRPINPSSGYYVTGHWGELPFRDGTFDGILGCESFPTHKSRVSDEDTIREITRVSQVGTIWRATLPFDIVAFAKAMGTTIILDDRREILRSQMLNNGWDVYVERRPSISSFIAKLQ